jgi:geranylgeranyl diphosphate synthase, type I
MTRALLPNPEVTVGDLRKQVEDGLRSFLAAEQVRRAVPDPRGALPVMEIASLAAAGGKRLRPVFCLTGYLAAGGVPNQDLVNAAMALELLHIGALIHDDVMDDSDLRRGAPTTHVKHADAHERQAWQGEARRYGDSIAIMAGLLAWTYADWLMPPTGEWFELRAELVAGQTLDVVAAAAGGNDPDLARHIARVKSGRYTIHRPLVIGATLAGRPELAWAFEQYGDALGEAFQLRDDLIDAYGNGEAGKPAGLDARQHKMTLLATTNRDDVERRIAELVRQARAAVADAPIGPEWKDWLAVMATKVAYRDR